jgi:PilZ domain
LYTLFGMTGDGFAVPRRSERKPVRKAVVLVIESEDSAARFDATTLDMSRHGARVQAETPLTPGQTLSLIQEEDPTHALRCTVVWAGEVGSDRLDHAGLEFLEHPPAGIEN